jgi:hypothetical protein
VLNERERREIGAAVEVVGRAEKAARTAQAAHGAAGGPRRAKAEADFVVERVTRLGEICRVGETMLDMLLGQLTLDVGRFRDAFKVSTSEPSKGSEPPATGSTPPQAGGPARGPRGRRSRPSPTRSR